MIKESDLGIRIPEIMLPEGKINMKKWSVVACDQFTSQPEYWYDVQKIVGNAPSAYNLILPEAFLNENDRSDRIAKIKSTMKSYVESGVLAQLPRGIALVERTIGNKKRKGIMLAIDLDQYDFQPGNKCLIRATEQTVLERIPPRMEVRTGAILESPHAMLLMNDEKDSVIGPLYKKRDTYFKLYGFDLMQNGGYLNGWFVDNEQDIQGVLEALGELKETNEMLFAVGDGNHSLVTAKAVWEEAKETLSEEEQEASPLRYALVEVVNLYDPGLKFEPIHRVIFNVSPSVCVNELMTIIHKRGFKAKMIYSRNMPQAEKNVHVLPFITKDTMGRIEIINPEEPLVVGTLQDILDEYQKVRENAVVDYIHGADSFVELSKQYNSIGFRMPGIEKEDLFSLVYKYGVLPKKCFSMGEAEEKRYYTECRLLVKMQEEKPQQAEPAEPVEEPVIMEEPVTKEEAVTPTVIEETVVLEETVEAAPVGETPVVAEEAATADEPAEADDLNDLDDLEDLNEEDLLHLDNAKPPKSRKEKKSFLKIRSKTHI